MTNRESVQIIGSPDESDSVAMDEKNELKDDSSLGAGVAAADITSKNNKDPSQPVATLPSEDPPKDTPDVPNLVNFAQKGTTN